MLLSNFLDVVKEPSNSFMFWAMIILWSIIFITTLIIELETADLTCIWFCLASLVSLVCAIFKMQAVFQVLVFAAVATLLILATKPITKKMMKTEIIHTNTDKLIGMVGTITKDIIDDSIGEVKVNNEFWRAICIEGDNIKTDEKVIITALSGNKVVVTKANKNNDIEII